MLAQRVNAWAGQQSRLTPRKLSPYEPRACHGGALGKFWACLLPLPWLPVRDVYKWSVFCGREVTDSVRRVAWLTRGQVEGAQAILTLKPAPEWLALAIGTLQVGVNRIEDAE